MIFSIPTIYKGYQFRSRKEACWAAFFDGLGLRWQYEWIDLRKYIPDFLIDERILAEVKGCSTVAELEPHVAKIEKSGWKGPWVLLGGHYTVQLGYKLKLPANAESLWADACNATQWKSKSKPRRVEYAQQKPVFDVEQFRTVTPAVVPVVVPVISLPKMPIFLPAVCRSQPTPPRLPSRAAFRSLPT